MKLLISVFFCVHIFGADWSDSFRRFANEDRRSPPHNEAILFTGSSTIRLWENLAQSMKPFIVLNRGFGGSTVQDLLNYYPKLFTRYQSKIFVLYSGDNDLAQGLSPNIIRKRYDGLINKTHNEFMNSHIIILGVKPSPARSQFTPQILTLNSMLKNLDIVKNNMKIHFIDFSFELLDEKLNVRREFFKQDLIHLNSKGYSIIDLKLRNLLRKIYAK